MTVFESLLNHDFSVLGMRRSSDGAGGFPIEYYVKGTIRGRLRPANSRERETAMREERFITHVFYCLADEDINRGDRLTPGVVSVDGFHIVSSDILVEVDGIREPSTAGAHWEIDCIERQFSESEYSD